MTDRARLTLVESPSCKVCTLPTEFLQLVHELRVPDIGSGQRAMALEDIADYVNLKLLEKGITGVELNRTNLSNHFVKHANTTTRAGHEALRDANGGRPPQSGVTNDFERVVNLFREVGGSDLSDTLLQMRLDYEQLFNDLKDDVVTLRTQIRENTKAGKPTNVEYVLAVRDVADSVVKMGKELRGTIESLKKIGNPRMMLRLFLINVLESFTRASSGIYLDIQKNLIRTLEREISGPDKEHLLELVRQHTETFAPRIESKFTEYKDEIEKLMKGWEE